MSLIKWLEIFSNNGDSDSNQNDDITDKTYEPYNFEEEDLEEDDYYYEDDEENEKNE